MPTKKLQQAISELATRPKENMSPDDPGHSRYLINRKHYRTVLVDNISFIFTCDENDKIRLFQNHSIIIENGVIKDVLPATQVKEKNFDLVYDAGKRGGTVVTPGLINCHSHVHMYLLRSAMMLDEEATVDETIAQMAVWQQHETDLSHAFAAVGDITEQQKNGITTTLTHGPSFSAAESAARMTGHNLINAVSAVSNSRPENNLEMVEKLLAESSQYHSQPAIALHYLFKTTSQDLTKISQLVEKYSALLTFHMAESNNVVRQTVKKHGVKETELLKRHGLLGPRSLASHAIHLQPEEIRDLAENQVGIVHLPTSNTIHKSGTFQFWQFHECDGFSRIALGTDSVVSKNRLDILTEAYQARITHLYSRTIKFGSLFKMMTAHGARVLNLGDRGRLLPGMKADLVFWKLRDRGFIPFNQDHPYTLLGNLITHGGRLVRDLMINGRFVIKDRRHQLVDESQLMNALQKKHMELRMQKNIYDTQQ